MFFLLISFLAGVLTVLAPCTIALLPVIVGGTLAGGKSMSRAVTVTISLGISVVLFTLLLKVSTSFVSVPQIVWEGLSGSLIALIGLTMLFPALWDRLSFLAKFNSDSNKVLNKGFSQQSFWGDVIVGASLGPVFSSCSPTYFLIIATILPKSFGAGAADLLAYVIGLCGMLLLIAIIGQKLTDRLNLAANPYGWLRRSIGLLFVIIGIAIATGLEQRFELAFANTTFLNPARLEQGLLANAPSGLVQNGVLAPDITGASGYANTDGQPITISQYKGKHVVLIDFWDYSCINCQREIPYVEAWYQKYKDQGLVVIGVHTPEFSFEKLQKNVEAAAQRLSIHYPIVLDNDYATWNAFGNQYWPQVYLINTDGQIVYSHSGEGNYAETEAAIQAALTDRAQKVGSSTMVTLGTVQPAGTAEVDGQKLGSPETYFGSDRNEYLGNGIRGSAGTQELTVPDQVQLNTLYLGGSWKVTSQYAETSDLKAHAVYQFDAKNVYFVATGNPSAKIRVLLDGKPIGTNAGTDVSKDGTVTIDADRLYSLVNLPDYGVHTLEIELESGTLDAYTFTFG